MYKASGTVPGTYQALSNPYPLKNFHFNKMARVHLFSFWNFFSSLLVISYFLSLEYKLR